MSYRVCVSPPSRRPSVPARGSEQEQGYREGGPLATALPVTRRALGGWSAALLVFALGTLVLPLLTVATAEASDPDGPLGFVTFTFPSLRGVMSFLADGGPTN